MNSCMTFNTNRNNIELVFFRITKVVMILLGGFATIGTVILRGMLKFARLNGILNSTMGARFFWMRKAISTRNYTSCLFYFRSLFIFFYLSFIFFACFSIVFSYRFTFVGSLVCSLTGCTLVIISIFFFGMFCKIRKWLSLFASRALFCFFHNIPFSCTINSISNYTTTVLCVKGKNKKYL